MKIALAFIAGDDCFEQGVERMLESAKGKVDGIFCSFGHAGGAIFEGVGKQLVETIRSTGVKYHTVSERDWNDDFSAARNHSFSLTPEGEFDWIFWCDCDDILPEELDLRAIAERAVEKKVHGVLLPYWYQVDEDGNPLTIHFKERLFRADVAWNWIRPLHEQCQGPIATRMYRISDMGHVVHLRGGGEKRERNYKIAARYWKEFEEGKHDDNRAVLFMANEIYALAEAATGQRADLAGDAINLYRRYLDSCDYSDPDVIEDNYSANLLVGRCLFLQGKWNDAINIYMQGIKLKPTWPAAYVTIAETYFAVGDYERAVQWAAVTINACSMPDTNHAPYDVLDLDYKPLMIEGAALTELGRFEEAVDAYDKAMTIRPDDYTTSVWDAAYARVQNQHISDTQTDNDVRKMREGRWGQKGTNERSIAFWTAPSVEQWDADLIDTRGSGGTEYVVTRLAQQLAKRGWRVVIFGTPRREGYDIHGVEWYGAHRWHPDENFDVFVTLRAPQLLDAEINAECKVLWLHDVNVGDEQYDDLGRDRFSRCDAIVCPSDWHKQHLQKVYSIGQLVDEDPYLVAIPNGFDRDLFLPRPGVTIREGTKFVYASSPDRGLPRLLDLWPEIRERRTKEAELHIFYGWEFVDKIAQAGLPTAPMLLALKERINKKIDDLGGEKGGIYWHGRVSQSVLADHFRGDVGLPAASLLLYPANFMETGGIVFAQAMTAGVLPIVPDLGNLGDLIDAERLIIKDAPPDSEVFGSLFLDRIDEFMLAYTSDQRQELVEYLQNRTLAYEWPRIVDHWESLFNSVLCKKDKAVA